MGTARFKWFLNGLSKESRFLDAINENKSKRQDRKGRRR